MEDEKSSKAIRVQWFIPVVPCGSQLNYSIRSRAFQAKRSPEVPNLSFRLLVFKHKALHSSASPYSPLYAAFCAQPPRTHLFVLLSVPPPSPSALPVTHHAHFYCCHCSHLPRATRSFSRQVLLSPRSSPQTLLAPAWPLLVPASWRQPVPVHYHSSSCHLRSLLLSLSMFA